MRSRLLLLALPVLLLSSLASAGKEVPWEMVNETDDHITVYNRELPSGRGVAEVKAELIINQPIDEVWKACTDHHHFVEYMPYVESIKEMGKGPDGSLYIYHRLDPPLVDRREYTLKIWDEIDKAKGLWIRRWALAEDKAPPPIHDCVHLKWSDGYWRLEKLGSRSTLVHYWVHTDPGGSVPLWIANKANSVSLPDLMRAIRSRAANPKWKRDD